MIRSTTPIRICDIGGWTDTWFAHSGVVLNIAVEPGVEITIEDGPIGSGITLDLQDHAETYDITIETRVQHALVEAAIRSVGELEVPLVVRIKSAVPPGASTGTSASVVVGLIKALSLARGEELIGMDLAMAAFRVETEMVGLQSGVQDQIAAAFGGVCFIEIDEFPVARVTKIEDADLIEELDARLLLVYLGHSHESSRVHEAVIASMGTEEHRALGHLRDAARAAKIAVDSRDLKALGAAMLVNTQGQLLLHNELVSHEAQQVFAIAEQHGALGWKVNGAGGAGGSVTLLCESATSRPHIAETLRTHAGTAGFDVHFPTVSPAGSRAWRSED